MKKMSIFTILIFLFIFSPLIGQNKNSQTIVNINKAYIYREGNLLISESDLNCSFLIKEGMPEDIKIVGAEYQFVQKIDFVDAERLFINKEPGRSARG